jgi:hypothetical protein
MHRSTGPNISSSEYFTIKGHGVKGKGNDVELEAFQDLTVLTDFGWQHLP